MSDVYSPVAGPHTHATAGVGGIMLQVMLALVPATLFGIWLYGWPALNLFVVTLSTCAIAEALSVRIGGRSAAAALGDGSALLTGWLLAMTLPPWAPWWIGVVGGLFAVMVGKQVFGGIGQNLFNPAMLARVVLLIAFPLELTTWIAPQPLTQTGSPGFVEGLAITFTGVTPERLDAVSSATLLGHLKTEIGRGTQLTAALDGWYEPSQAWFGHMAGSFAETSALLILLGGLYLMVRRIIDWQIPAAMLGTLALLASLMHMIAPERYADAGVHLLSGGAMLGAFFIATDPVTSPSTLRGRLLFGAGCGLLVYVIRSFGGYPEGVAFAVLLMNAVTPLIDHYVRPRIYGRDIHGRPRTIASKPKPDAEKPS
ncbi:MAG: RnfABCDGE type electron transport complex subunit D [Ectothiorhodospiraceae bacterium]|jgi:electron transport complex protein RnfD|nr:RnfABCDGE type electron transport complex subunit D [Ectothiorhodospiraceae bacterium]